jgi:hypothetical protein
MRTMHTPGSTASKMNMPGFTAECALSGSGRGYRGVGLPRREPSATASDVRASLIRGGGGSESNFWCDETAGTCSCLGGSLSDDCWNMQQYCVTSLQCSPYPPYKCDCNYRLVRPPGSIFTSPVGGGIFTRF